GTEHFANDRLRAQRYFRIGPGLHSYLLSAETPALGQGSWRFLKMKLKDTTVLVVDDEPMLLDIFSDWLREEDCHVWTAGDGAGALQILRDNHVDVIVSDLRMPVMDGVALVKKLPMSSPNQPKVIFISGFTDLEPREAYQLGVEALLQKPIERLQFV